MLSPHLDLARTLAADRHRDLAADARARRLRRESRSRYAHPVFRAGSRRRPEETARREVRGLLVAGQTDLVVPAGR